MKKIFILTLFAINIISSVYSQDYVAPMDIPLYLSANFGELRNNHFHSGIDFKTQQITGIPVKSIKDGYVSRISVSPVGYGRALYIDHPDGTTSVYGHLDRFAKQIEFFVLDSQYIKESFSVDMNILIGLLPVKKGEIVAYSGNTGSSGGPHLHFEIRETKTSTPIDPLPLFKHEISDNRDPQVQAFMIYPQLGKGIVNGKITKEAISIKTDKKTGKKNILPAINAWGTIGIGIKAYDYMNKTTNNYGVKEIKMTVDNRVVFHTSMEKFDFSETRFINSFIDWNEWDSKKVFYMKSFIEPGNRLNIYKTKTDGLITIDQEKVYQITYTLKDSYNNTTTFSFDIQGKKQVIPYHIPDGILFAYNKKNEFNNDRVKLTIPKDNLYTDIYFNYSSVKNYTEYASLHKLNKQQPLHSYCPLSITIDNDSYPDKQKYGIIFVGDKKDSWIGGKYNAGKISTGIRMLGNYSVTVDTIPPVITEVTPNLWAKNNKISFKIKDDLSGINKWHATLDGSFVLFEYDAKTSSLFCKYDSKRMELGTKKFELWVEDDCGNRTTYKKTITW